ncbi:MAG: Riboflavin synthase [Planctomycetota bacterium]|jgi:riboflavin synthase
MFTGLVQVLGEVLEVHEEPGGRLLQIRWPDLDIAKDGEIQMGESIAVNGCCLTVIDHSCDRFAFQAGPETLLKTNLGSLVSGSKVNLERALRLSDRLGGHIVQGHVDTTARLLEHRPEGPWAFLKFEIASAWSRLLVPKGSIAVDGVSLTVVEVGENWFTNMLIPHTLAVTTLGIRKPGDMVNLETDILAKHVQRLLDTSITQQPVAY